MSALPSIHDFQEPRFRLAPDALGRLQATPDEHCAHEVLYFARLHDQALRCHPDAAQTLAFEWLDAMRRCGVPL